MIRRRLLLQGVAVALLAGCEDVRSPRTGGTEATQRMQLQALTPLLELAKRLPEAERTGLADAVAPLLARLEAGTEDVWAAEVRALIAEDFHEQRLCEVDGWQLSRTECGLAAAVAAAAERGELGPGVQTKPASAYPEGAIASVTGWGPQRTRVGVPFNVQRDGHSGLWIQATGAPSYVKVMIGGIVTPARVRNDVITTGLYEPEHEALLDQPGEIGIELIDPVRELRQPVGRLSVLAAEPVAAATFCEVREWGPRRTRAGVAANPQANGSMGLWFRTDCVPTGAGLWFGEDQLPLTRRPFGFTSSIPVALLEVRGETPLTLRAADGSRQLVGTLRID